LPGKLGSFAMRLSEVRFGPRLKPTQRKRLTTTYKIEGGFQAFVIGWMLGGCPGATVTSFKGAKAMRKSSAIFVSAVALGLAMFVPLKASAQGVTIYINPGYPGYGAGYPGYGAGYPGHGAGYPAYAPYYGYSYPSYGYAYPSYGYGYGYSRPYYGTYWGHNRRVARRVNRRWDRWD
jgi:hypothetical protein